MHDGYQRKSVIKANDSADKYQVSLYTTHNQSAGGNHRSVIFRSVSHHSSVVLRRDDSADTTPMIVFDPSGATTHPSDQNAISTQVINRISDSISVYRGSIRTSNQLKPQSDLTRSRHQRPAQVCFLTESLRSLTEASGSPNLPKQLTIQLNTKPNQLSTYGQGSRLLTTTQQGSTSSNKARMERITYPEAQI
ncbi:calmodulin-binding transcription activator 2 [Dorcoceras hygrometricum]|uniref:Calmodulin-binding transcription activator 2 n=1 Tax=Dorcoceras hygrometricum TaxID=472368 RepID=A0A2Z7CX76_9LAMI|nr:calmodulin-binding transcription activator 2 [Dorcoceras hygrometricum]